MAVFINNLLFNVLFKLARMLLGGSRYMVYAHLVILSNYLKTMEL